MAYPIPLGKYLLLERVAAGGMAEVFKAKAFGVAGFEKLLAIKRLLPGLAADEEFIDMFIDEARIAVCLSHANLVQVYELGKVDGDYYIAMEYVSGVTLQRLTRRLRRSGQLVPLSAVAYIVGSVCEGLDYAHRKTDPAGRPMNVVHRDVSPQNVLLSYEGVT
ncbi:MAG: protein kinase, partial [Myxococcota bacterium]